MALLIFGCDDEGVGPPSTGSVSGKITSVGNQPDSGLVYVNAAVHYPIMGPTDYYKVLEVERSQTEVTYRLEGMKFGTYAAIAVSWKDLTGRGVEIVVTAARREQTTLRTSATVRIMEGAEMQARGMRSLDQALETLPGVTLNRSSGAAVNAVQIRGTSDVRGGGGGIGNRVLLLIDGRPAISPDTGGAFWSMLSTGIVERVQVVKGAFSALYGSNAMGGVIHVVTKSPTDVHETRVRLRYGLYGRPPAWMRITERRSTLSTVEVSRSGGVDNEGYFRLFGRDASDGVRRNGDYARLTFYGKWTHRFKPDRLLSVSAGRNVLERGYPHPWDSILRPLEVAPEYTNDRQKKQDWNVDAAFQSAPGLSGKLYFYEHRSESLTEYTVTSTADRLGGILQMEPLALSSRQVAEKHQVVVGMDASMDWVDAQPESVSYGKHRVHSAAGFLQDEIEIGTKGKVTLGLRYDYRKVQGRSGKGQWSPKVGGIWNVFEPTTLRCSIGRAFRDPSLAEMYIKQAMGGGVQFKPNPTLRAEKMMSAEIGLRHRLRDVALLDATFFGYALSDMIFWQEDTVAWSV